MDEDKCLVLDFIYITCKQKLCIAVGLDFLSSYSSYMQIIREHPTLFSRRLIRDSKQCTVDKDIWNDLSKQMESLFKSKRLSKFGRIRCQLAIFEFALPFYEYNVLNCLSLANDSLAEFYSSSEPRTMNWVDEWLIYDNRLLSKICYRILSGNISETSASHYKDLLIYTHMLCTCENRKYVDLTKSLTIRTLWLIRRALEHCIFGQFSAYDVSTTNSVLGKLPLAPLCYCHTNLDYSTKDSEQGKTKYIVGTGGSVLSFDCSIHQNSYLGCLQLLSIYYSNTKTLWCDTFFNHHLIPSPISDQDFVFDTTSLLPHVSRNDNKNFNILKRAEDFQSIKEYKTRPSVCKKTPPCRRSLLVKKIPNTVEKIEEVFKTQSCYVNSYLLCAIAKNSTSMNKEN